MIIVLICVPIGYTTTIHHPHVYAYLHITRGCMSVRENHAGNRTLTVNSPMSEGIKMTSAAPIVTVVPDEIAIPTKAATGAEESPSLSLTYTDVSSAHSNNR